MGADRSSFDPGDAPPDHELNELKQWGTEAASNALELTLVGQAKKLVGHPLFQRVLGEHYATKSGDDPWI
jgi:hypothetical protein